MDDAVEATCGPKLEAYYECAGVTDEDPDNTAYYYSSEEDEDDEFCEALDRIDCSTIECQSEYEDAMACYAEASCDAPFSCADTPEPPTTTESTKARLAFYNVNAEHDAVCFSFGTTPAASSSSGLVSFGSVVHVDLAVAERAQAFVKVSETCDGTALANNIADVYSTSASNLVSFGVSAYLSTVRLDGPETTSFFLNEFSADAACTFSWTDGLATQPNGSVALHQATTLDLDCDGLRSAGGLHVDCGDGRTASIDLTAKDICADTSLHFVATKNLLGDLELRLFQATDACRRTCEDDDDDDGDSTLPIGALAAIVVAGLFLLVLVCVFAYCRCRAAPFRDKDEYRIELGDAPTTNEMQMRETESLTA